MVTPMIVSSVDEGHDGGERQRRDARPLSQRNVRDITVGRCAHYRLFEIVLRAFDLRLQLIDSGLVLFDVKTSPGIILLQLGHLRESQLLELELSVERVDLRLERHRIDFEEDVIGLERLVRFDRTSITSPATLGTIATD